MDDATSSQDEPYDLRVKYADPALAELYADAPRQVTVEGALMNAIGGQSAAEADAGWDLRFTKDETVMPGSTHTFEFGVSVQCVVEGSSTPLPLLMLPRSSIVKTPLRMANSIGLIDSGYRGTLKAVVDHRGSEPYEVKRGQRLFQLVALPTQAMQWRPVASLPNSARGDGGFGSTGN